MSSLKIQARRLTPGEFEDNARLVKWAREQLLARGFCPDPTYPLEFERSSPAWGEDESVVISQPEPPGRIGKNHPQAWPLFQRIAQGDIGAYGPLLGLLLAEGDDRAAYLQALPDQVAMPEEAVVYADFGGQSDGHNSEQVEGAKVAARELCGRILLLFGLRE